MPEPGSSSPVDEPVETHPAAAAPLNPFLSRLELELPDGRYLFVYHHLEPISADA